MQTLIALILPLAFLAQTNAEEPKVEQLAAHLGDAQNMNEFVNKLTQRALEVWPRQDFDLDSTTIAKPGTLRIPQLQRAPVLPMGGMRHTMTTLSKPGMTSIPQESTQALAMRGMRNPVIVMGRGDIRTRKGKRKAHSFGNTRPKVNVLRKRKAAAWAERNGERPEKVGHDYSFEEIKKMIKDSPGGDKSESIEARIKADMGGGDQQIDPNKPITLADQEPPSALTLCAVGLVSFFIGSGITLGAHLLLRRAFIAREKPILA